MLLAVDCGNSNTVFSVWDGSNFIATYRISTHWQRTADQYFVWLSSLMKLNKLEVEINEVIISSTVPRVVFNLRVLADRYFDSRPIVVGKGDCRLPVDVRVDMGTNVGPDRLVNTVAGFSRYGGNLIIVDFGTATTFDVVASDGAYIGGVIAPGVNVSLEAFHQAAAALPHVDVTKPDRVIGTNTEACMQSGIFWGYIGLVKETTAKIKEEYGKEMKVVGTGGLVPLFQQGDDIFDIFDDDLTMRGLVEINEFNRKIK
ncbi:MAG: type III pantothenate kinase [Rhodobacteraceae bacterium]|nr:type III pantothenate kinase [Paracoccaceae bacterium]MBT4778458.1 type III pantothenate kinase [Paracoccaceae bacterium]MBT6437046.1 type III pantothenate kinase [Paracoccaceae bacterium]